MEELELNRDEKKKVLFNLMIGGYDAKQIPEDVASLVENEMEPGSVCDKLYAEVYEKNRRLCERLDVEEDADIECIINNLFEMAEYLSTKMFEYGTDQSILDELDADEWITIK